MDWIQERAVFFAACGSEIAFQVLFVILAHGVLGIGPGLVGCYR